MQTGEDLRELHLGESYRYLGVSQVFETKARETKERIKQEYYTRVSKTWRSELNARGKVAMSNSWAISVLRYYQGIVKWSGRDLISMDRETRKIICQNKSHNRSASLERLYLPRKDGGRGLQGVQLTWEREVVNCGAYLLTSEDRRVQVAMLLQTKLSNMGKYTLIGKANEILRKYDLTNLTPLEEGSSADTPKTMVANLRKAQQKVQEDRLSRKPLHGVYTAQVKRPETDRKSTYAWLTDSKLKSETESLIVAAQDGVVQTAVYRVKIKGEPGSLACRMCDKDEETVGHILSSCESYKWGIYKERHDRMLFQVVKAVAASLKIRIPKHLRAPGGVIKPGTVGPSHMRLLIDQNIPTDRKVANCRPDLVVRLIKEKRIIIFEVACAWEPLVKTREREKWLKYQELAADLAKQWSHFKVDVIPVVTGNLGLIVGLKRYLRKARLMNSVEIDQLIKATQREALCSAVRLIRRHMGAG